MWQAPLTGQVFDPPSLDTFWQELTQGAYGRVQRAKGIFELADGQAFHFDFVGSPARHSLYRTAPTPLVEGRPPKKISLQRA